MKKYHSRALSASLAALIAFFPSLTFTTDSSADEEADGSTLVDKLTMANDDKRSIQPSDPVAPPPAAKLKTDNSNSESKPDMRFVKRVQGLEQMSEGLQNACDPTGSTKPVDEKSLTNAILAYLRSQIATREMRINEIDLILKELKTPNEELKKKKIDLKKEIEKYKTAKTYAQDAAAEAAELINAGNVDGICTELCRDEDTPKFKNIVNVCKIGDAVTATAAIIADPRSVEGLARYLRQRTQTTTSGIEKTPIKIKLKAKLSKTPTADEQLEIKFADLPMEVRYRTAPLLLSVAGATDILDAKRSGVALDVGALSMRTMDVALAALAKVIEDRAKREGLVWFLERMHENVCAIEKAPKDAKDETVGDQDKRVEKNKSITEVRTYWLKNTCALAEKRSEFMQYGGGAELLGAFRGAIASDLKMWPGAAAGFGAATMFVKDAKDAKSKPEKLLNHLDCYTEGLRDHAICKAVAELRRSTAKLTIDLMAGVNASIALDEYGTAIHRLNVNQRSFYNNQFEMAACAASLPLVFQEYEAEVEQLDLNRFDATEALLLGALTRSPACFAITGAGWKTAECKAFDPDTATTAKTACEDKKKMTPAMSSENDQIERLTTILRWSGQVHQPARDVVGRWAVLRSANKLFKDAFDGMAENADAIAPTPPPFQFGTLNDSKTIKEAFVAAQNYATTTARTRQQSKQVKFLQTSLGLAHASVDFGVSVTAAGKSVTKAALIPGFCPELFATLDATCGKDYFSEGHDVLVKLSDQLGTIEATLTGDWGKVVPKVIAEIRTDLEIACKGDEKCAQLATRLARYAGVFTALATDSDPDATARALDAAAMPIGGWRRKLVPDSTTISIASFPGLAAGFEWRKGQYGATYERFDDRHLVSPTLTMPVGIDFALNCATSTASGARWMPKFFVSLLDPAAYLQYDVEKDGRLPGAQILTALSPGLAVRFTPADSPFSVNLYGLFRPNFRAWESGLSVPAAHAIQAGVSLSIDVTLFEIFASEPGVEF